MIINEYDFCILRCDECGADMGHYRQYFHIPKQYRDSALCDACVKQTGKKGTGK